MIRGDEPRLERNILSQWPNQAAVVVVAPVISIQTAKRSAITCRYSGADSRCRRGRKCGEITLNADRNCCACRIDLKRFIIRSRCRVGWCEFSARLLRYLDCRCCTDGITSRCATA